MAILLTIALVIMLLLLKNKKILLKIKSFFRNCKLLIILEVAILIGFMIFIIFNNTIRIVEKDPHSNKVLKSVNLKEGQIYTYKTMYFEKNEESTDFAGMMQTYKEKYNIIKIEDIGITKVKVSINEIEKDYKYGTGFSYYGIASCSCGTPIIFERTLQNVIKILLFSFLIIDLLLIVLIKGKDDNILIKNS